MSPPSPSLRARSSRCSAGLARRREERHRRLDASVFLAPDGSDARSCRTRATACASFGRAYRVARPGQIVEVAAGRYPAQSITAVPGRTGPNVVIRPAAGARVTLGGLTLGVSGELGKGPAYLTVRGMHL